MEQIKGIEKQIENQIENQRNLIHKILNREFTDRQIADIWHEINELIELEIKMEITK